MGRAAAVTPTADPSVYLEERRPGYARYVNREGRRWEVHGTCDRRGDCLVGATVAGEFIRDRAHLEDLARRLGRDRVDSELDVPVTPEFKGCCPFTYVELEPVPPF